MSDHKGTHSFHVKNGNFAENSRIPGFEPISGNRKVNDPKTESIRSFR